MLKTSFFLISLISFSCLGNIKYPQSWWENNLGIKNKVPSWEILPSEGVIGESVILSKRNELGILSNFAATPFKYDGKTYKSLEGAWQAMKYPEDENDRRYGQDKLPYLRKEVEQMVGFEAKRAGGLASKLMKKHNVNFVTYKGQRLMYRVNRKGEHYNLIKKLMRAKLDQNTEVKTILQSTGKLNLLPDHHYVGKITPPAWKYYDIWMELRDKL